jgi:hypothetical protein
LTVGASLAMVLEGEEDGSGGGREGKAGGVGVLDSSSTDGESIGGGGGQWARTEEGRRELIEARDENEELGPYRFLFQVYSLDFFWFECLEM